MGIEGKVLETIGERLKEAREYLNLSQNEISQVVGISRSAISLIESNQRKVDAIELAKFSEIYQQPESYFTGTDAVQEPKAIKHLARTASGLSEADQNELLQFARFLESRSTGK